jgi:hypothetical protein
VERRHDEDVQHREAEIDQPEDARGFRDPWGELLELGPGASDFINWAPFTATSGRIAIINTMIPIPPSHWVSWRHRRSACECWSREISPSTVAPVVVKPDVDSKSALTGWATVASVP